MTVSTPPTDSPLCPPAAVAAAGQAASHACPADADLHRLFAVQRAAFEGNRWPTRAQRLSALSRLQDLLSEEGPALAEAIDADFGGRSRHETRLAELFVVQAAIRHAQRHLRTWMRPRRIRTAWHFWPAGNSLWPQPLGVVGVLSPWNYPLQLALGPAVAALAAGNRVMIKPSELTPCFSARLEVAVGARFEPAELVVCGGGVERARAFAALPWDHLIFTGSTAVGRAVAQTAAAHLTPVTLELGGKSPAIIDRSADLARALPRIAFGKWFNAGQTCIAPDYLLVPDGMTEAVVQGLRAAVARQYPTLWDNADYTAIVSDSHRQRLKGLVNAAVAEGARAVVLHPAGHTVDPTGRKLAPTLLLGATPAMRVMREEIFGPVLPVIEYRSLDEALAHVNAGPRPLALYWFGNHRAHRERVLRETHAGGVTLDDCLWHIAQEDLPFGGVGDSGQGAYHGQWGFDRFSHLKPVFRQSRWSGTGWFHPPYGRTFEWLLRGLQRLA